MCETKNENSSNLLRGISENGGTPLVVCENERIMGVIELQDIIKTGIRERFERLRQTANSESAGVLRVVVFVNNDDREVVLHRAPPYYEPRTRNILHRHTEKSVFFEPLSAYDRVRLC